MFDRVADLALDPDGAPIFVGRFNGSLEVAGTTLTGEGPSLYVVKLEAD